MASREIKLPKGFELDAPIQPSVPEGFELDAPQSGLPEGFELDNIETPPSKPMVSPDSFLGRTNEVLVKRGVNIADELTPKQTEGLYDTLSKAPERALRVTGQAAGFLGDVVTEGAKSLYKTFMPESTQESIKQGATNILQTPIGQQGLKAIKAGTDTYAKFKQRYPDAAKDIEAVVNIASILPVNKAPQAIKATGKEGINIAKDVKTIATQTTVEAVDKQIGNTVNNGILKAIRPSVEGKKTATQMNAYLGRAKEAVQTIVQNKGNLKLTDEFGEAVEGLPQNLKQFSQAIDQTKKDIFTQYDSLAKRAGQSGATLDLQPISRELEIVANSKVLNTESPAIAQYAKDRAVSYIQAGAYTAEEAQEALKILNNSLDAFYKNPTYETASKAYIDSLVANKLRKSLDDVIEQSTGQEYQKLKNTYGALKAIEKDVNRRAVVDARKNVKGLIDFSDIFSGSQVVYGIMSANPALVTAGMFAKTVAALYKIKNNPNRMIKNLFEDTEKLMDKRTMAGQEFSLKSKVGQKIKEFNNRTR